MSNRKPALFFPLLNAIVLGVIAGALNLYFDYLHFGYSDHTPHGETIDFLYCIKDFLSWGLAGAAIVFAVETPVALIARAVKKNEVNAWRAMPITALADALALGSVLGAIKYYDAFPYYFGSSRFLVGDFGVIS